MDIPESETARWMAWAHEQGIDPHWQQVLVDAGGGREAADHWVVVFADVPRERWVNVQVDPGDGSWRDVPLPGG